MNSFAINLILACALMHVAHGVYSITPQHSPNLAHLFLRSSLALQDPAISMACFSDYIAKTNEVSELYGKNYNKCLLDAKTGRQAIEDEMVGKRIAIGENSGAICKRLSTCNDLKSTLEILNCHAKIGANNTKAVYSISGNASEYATVMQEKYRIIDLRHEQCCKSAERSYVEGTTDKYRKLQDCLGGHGKVPSLSATTTTPTTTSTTTTTTPQPSTTTTSTTSTTTPQPSTSTTSTTTTTTPQPSTTTTTTTSRPITFPSTSAPVSSPTNVKPAIPGISISASLGLGGKRNVSV